MVKEARKGAKTLRRRTYFFLVCMMLCVSRLVAAGDTLRDCRELAAIEQQLADDLDTGDTASWSAHLAPDFFIVTEDGTRMERKELIESMRPLPKGYQGHIRVTQPRCSMAGDAVVISYVSDEHLIVFGQPLHTSYAVMNTWSHAGNNWQMVASQVFEIPELPKPITVADSVLKKYAGTYSLNDSVTCSVTFEDHALMFAKKGKVRTELLPETPNVFMRETDHRGRIIFLLNESGRMELRERRNGQDIVWRKK